MEHYKLYDTEDGDKVLELWGASTKHSDSRFCFSNFKKVDYIEEDLQVFQWVLECASKLTWPPHAKALAEWALENVYKW